MNSRHAALVNVTDALGRNIEPGQGIVFDSEPAREGVVLPRDSMKRSVKVNDRCYKQGTGPISHTPHAAAETSV